MDHRLVAQWGIVHAWVEQNSAIACTGKLNGVDSCCNWLIVCRCSTSYYRSEVPGQSRALTQSIQRLGNNVAVHAHVVFVPSRCGQNMVKKSTPKQTATGLGMEEDVAFVQQLLQGNPQYARALDVDDAPASSPPSFQRRLQRARARASRSRASGSNNGSNAQQQPPNHRCVSWWCRAHSHHTAPRLLRQVINDRTSHCTLCNCTVGSGGAGWQQHCQGQNHTRRLLGQKHFDTNSLVMSTFEMQAPARKQQPTQIHTKLAPHLPALQAVLSAASKTLAHYAAVGNPAEFNRLRTQFFGGVGGASTLQEQALQVSIMIRCSIAALLAYNELVNLVHQRRCPNRYSSCSTAQHPPTTRPVRSCNPTRAASCLAIQPTGCSPWPLW